jgi:hypothetical protein
MVTRQSHDLKLVGSIPNSDKKLSSLEKDIKINEIRTELNKIEAKTKD